MRRWPDSLPPSSWPDYELQPADPAIRTAMDSGAPRVRATTLATSDDVTGEYRLTDEQMWAFRQWYFDLPVGDWGSDRLTGWTLTGATAAASSTSGPMGETVDDLVEDGTTGLHRAARSVPSLLSGQTGLVFATLRAALRSRARVELVGRDGVARHATVDLSAGTVTATSGTESAALTARGNGWWRLAMTVPAGTGGAAAEMRVTAVDGAGNTSFAGGSAAALGLAELQARPWVQWRNLFVPAADDGTALGAGRGTAWFFTDLYLGGGLTRVEARARAMWSGRIQPGFNWIVRLPLERRDA